MILSEIIFNSMLQVLGSDIFIGDVCLRAIFEATPVSIDCYGNSVLSSDPRATVALKIGKTLTGDEIIIANGTKYQIREMRNDDGKKTTQIDLMRV